MPAGLWCCASRRGRKRPRLAHCGPQSLSPSRRPGSSRCAHLATPGDGPLGGRLVSPCAALHCAPFRLAPRDPRNCARSDPQACAAGDGHRQRCSTRALLGCRASPLWPQNGCAPCHERINVDRAAALAKGGSSPLPTRLDAYSLELTSWCQGRKCSGGCPLYSIDE